MSLCFVPPNGNVQCPISTFLPAFAIPALDMSVISGQIEAEEGHGSGRWDIEARVLRDNYFNPQSGYDSIQGPCLLLLLPFNHQDVFPLASDLLSLKKDLNLVMVPLVSARCRPLCRSRFCGEELVSSLLEAILSRNGTTVLITIINIFTTIIEYAKNPSFLKCLKFPISATSVYESVYWLSILFFTF